MKFECYIVSALFQGHDLLVHRHYYRMSDSVIERTKVATVLMALEEGKLQKHDGKTLEDVLQNYKPNESGSESETDSEDEVPNTQRQQRRPFPKELSQKLFQHFADDIAAGLTPRKAALVAFLEQNPGPSDLSWKDCKWKISTKIRSNKRQPQLKKRKLEAETKSKPKKKKNSS